MPYYCKVYSYTLFYEDRGRNRVLHIPSAESEEVQYRIQEHL